MPMLGDPHDFHTACQNIASFLGLSTLLLQPGITLLFLSFPAHGIDFPAACKQICTISFDKVSISYKWLTSVHSRFLQKIPYSSLIFRRESIVS